VEALMFKGQSAGGTRPHDPAKEALWNSPMEQGEVRGNHAGHVARTSAYTAAAQHPWRSLAILGGIAAVGGLVFIFEKERSALSKAFREEPAGDRAA
jgi:hypothetical protein